MKKFIIYGAIGFGIYYFCFRKNPQGTTILQSLGAQGGTLSSQPASQYPMSIPQAARADNNSFLNNQPWAQKIVNSAQSDFTVQNVSSAASSIAGIFKDLFSSSTGSDSGSEADYNDSDLDYANAYVGDANLGTGYDDSSLYDGSYDDSSNFGFA